MRWTADAKRYGVAIALVGLAFAARAALDAALGPSAPLIVFTLAVSLSAWYGGLGPGLVATVFGAVAGSAFLLQAGVEPKLPALRDVVQLALYIVVGSVISVAFERMHALQRRVRLRADLLDQSQEAIFAWSLDGTLRYWNRGAERLYGWRHDEALGRESHGLLAAPDTRPVAEILAGLASTGSWSGELVHRAQDGRELPVESRMTLVRRRDGRTIVMEANRDLTARRAAQRALQERELRLGLALEGAGLHFWALDPATRSVDGDAAVFTLHGLAPAASADMDTLLARIAPDDLPAVDAVLTRALREPGSYRVTYRVRGTSDGQRWVLAVLRAVEEARADRPRLRVVGFVQDATAAMRADAELRAREAEFRLLADSIPQLAWMARPDGTITWFNQRWYEYTGARPDDVLGWKWESVHDPYELPRVVSGFRAAIARGEPWEDTFPLRRHDGAMRWHLSRALPLRDAAGRVTLWFGTNTDITERLEMEAHLRDADRRKDEFLATLAHELRNPLAPLGNGLQILRRPDVPPATAAQVGAMMQRQLAQMVRLIDDLLDVSRITRGKLVLKRERTTLARIVEAAVETTRPAVEQARHALAVRLPPEPLALDADETRLAQAFANLISNAVKYTPAGGHIAIEAERSGANAVVRVVDDGIGIPPEALRDVFELFAQVRGHQSHAAGGLGIGLSLVRALVGMHGGSVGAHSDGPGRGSAFTVRLPLASSAPVGLQGAAVHAAVPAAADGVGSGDWAGMPSRDAARGLRVLVADDNADAAQSLALLLRIEGCDVRIASDGAEAVQMADEFRPRIVFMDLGMPTLDGLEATRRIRREPWSRGMRIVALTGWGQDGDRQRSRAAGVDQHCVKPIEPEALGRLLAEVAALPDDARAISGRTGP